MSIRLIPSLLIPEIHFPVKEEKGASSSLIETYASEGFYRSFEIADIASENERRRIGWLVGRYDIEVTQWLPSLITRNHLDLSSLDAKVRTESVRQIKENLYYAAECGAGSIALISGKDPGPNRRSAALTAMFDSLSEICEEAERYKINVLLESIDYRTSKNGLLGPIHLVSEIIDRLKESYNNMGLVFDTTHIALNGEDIFKALEQTGSQIKGIHLSNAVLDTASDLYGDNHIPPGEPGFLTEELIGQFLRKVDRVMEGEVKVAIEIRCREIHECRPVEKMARRILESHL